MQRHRFFRRLTLSLRRGHHDQQFLVGNIFKFIVAGIDQGDIELRGNKIVTQGFRHTARITGLRGGDERDPRHFGSRCRNNRISARLLIQHAPEIARNPRKLRGREIGRGRLKACQLFRV